MAHLYGTFSDPNAGRLQLVLKGTYEQGTARDAGFPAGDTNILVRALVGPVGGTVVGQSEPIDRYAPTVTFEVDYPGGNAVWQMSTETVAYSYGTAFAMAMRKLKLTAVLTKK